MIEDMRDRKDGSTIDADLVIIGGGMAGITLAREWAGQKKRVLILESGGSKRDDATQDLYEGSGTLAAKDNPEVKSDDYLGGSRARFYGGSGNWWGGKCVPLDAVDFEARPWIKGSGWPMTRADLQPFYDRACDVLAIPHFDKDYSQLQHQGRPPLDINGSRHMTSLPRTHTGVSGRNKETYDEFRFGFTKEKNISVYLHANVVDFELTADGARVEALAVATLPNKQNDKGKRFRVRAGHYVLACGGIENARLLLAANAKNGGHFGRSSGAIGRYFQGHTVVGLERTEEHSGTRVEFTTPPESLSLYVDRSPKNGPHAVLGTTSEGQRHYQSAGFTVTMGLDPSPGGEAEGAIRTTALRLDRGDGTAAGGGASCGCYFMTENLPNPDSRVTLDGKVDALGMPRAKLRWEYGATDLDQFERSIDAVARELGSAGLARVSAPLERNSITTNMSPSRHHMGTTRMHPDPAEGVVDANLKLHDTSNLYIAGSSVFPTSGIANPTLTILALTLRLSDHLKEIIG